MIICGDALVELTKLKTDSIDCIVTDPPYGYSFMNKDWDKVVVSVDIWKECLRVLKPGAFAFIMCAPRQDVLSRQIVNLQDAGFLTGFTSLYWSYAAGFPKAANTTKLLQKRGINKPELNGSYLGWQPKPAVEIILVVMKPLSEKSYVDQALANKHGVTWLDSCRIPYTNENIGTRPSSIGYKKWIVSHGYRSENILKKEVDSSYKQDQSGRFPANLLVSDDVLNDGRIIKPSKFRGSFRKHGFNTTKFMGRVGLGDNTLSYDVENYGDSGSYSRYFDLDKWFDTTFPFAIVAKPSKREKNMGLDKWINPETQKPEKLINVHPTVKALKLMSYLIMLGSREGDTILDPFCGSGTTLIAAKMLQRVSVGIELNPDYVKIAEARLSNVPSKTMSANVSTPHG